MFGNGKSFCQGFGTIGPAINELKIRPGFWPFPLVSREFAQEASRDSYNNPLFITVFFRPCGYEGCLLTLKLWVQIPAYLQLKIELNYCSVNGRERVGSFMKLQEASVVIVTALFLHHLAVICCILHITACVVLTPS